MLKISKLSYHHWLLVGFLTLQTVFWYNSHQRLPKMTVVPSAPSKSTLHALSFGDQQFLFRLMAFQLGNSGDTFGRNTALKDYDLSKIKDWFIKLFDFDSESQMPASLASYYFSQTQNKPDAINMVEYLRFFSKDRPKMWWWQAQAAYIAMHTLENNKLAIEIAKPLQTIEGIPMWARQLSAFVYEQEGEMDAAFHIMESILENAKDIPQSELNFMHHFVEERLNKLNELNDKATDRLSGSTFVAPKN